MTSGYLEQPWRQKVARETAQTPKRAYSPVPASVIAKEVTRKGGNSKRVEPMGMENKDWGPLPGSRIWA